MNKWETRNVIINIKCEHKRAVDARVNAQLFIYYSAFNTDGEVKCNPWGQNPQAPKQSEQKTNKHKTLRFVVKYENDRSFEVRREVSGLGFSPRAN